MKKAIYGAKALVYLNYLGDIESLAGILAHGLNIPEITVEHRETPPYELIGSCEVFGLEAWLQSSDALEGYSYSFEMSTTHSLDEEFNDRMHDLSLWLARFISDICDIETCAP